MKNEYFIKKQIGKKVVYEPISDSDSDFSRTMKYGSYVSIVTKGSNCTKPISNPAIAPFVAASMILREHMVEIIHDAHSIRLPDKPLTAKQVALWDEFSREFNLTSSHDIAESILNKIQVVAEDLLVNTLNKEAYDHFLLISTLSKPYIKE